MSLIFGCWQIKIRNINQLSWEIQTKVSPWLSFLLFFPLPFLLSPLFLFFPSFSSFSPLLLFLIFPSPKVLLLDIEGSVAATGHWNWSVFAEFYNHWVLLQCFTMIDFLLQPQMPSFPDRNPRQKCVCVCVCKCICIRHIVYLCHCVYKCVCVCVLVKIINDPKLSTASQGSPGSSPFLISRLKAAETHRDKISQYINVYKYQKE